MEQREEIKKLFELYLAGRTDAAQEERLFRYLHRHRITADDLEREIYGSWEREPTRRDDSEKSVARLSQVWDRIGKRQRRRGHTLRIAAYGSAAMLIVGLGLWLSVRFRQQPAAVNERTVQLSSRTTEPGEKIRMILPDGTEVFLGGSSTLTWPETFEHATQRNVRLQGEGFFVVTRDTTKPFIVRSGNIDTRVLGTSFNIYAYPEDGRFSLSVRTGRVAVTETTDGTQRELAVLDAGMQLDYENETGQYGVNPAHLGDTGSWTGNRFVFRNEKLGTLLHKLERYYRVKLTWKGTLPNCRMNATFDNISIKEVLEQLRIMSGDRLHYQLNDDNTNVALWGEVCR